MTRPGSARSPSALPPALGPPPPRVDPQALLGPGSVAARLLTDPLVLLGGQRALLMQVAHPLVAAGVAEHSGFPANAYERLLRTLSALATVAFAEPAAAGRAAQAVAGTHRRVRGTSPAGVPYSAGDPVLCAWVHATIVDSTLAVDRRYLRACSEEERETFYREMLLLGAAFGARSDDLPTGLADFGAWMECQVEKLEVGDQALAIAGHVLSPPRRFGRLGRVVEPAVWSAMRAVTADLLPPRLNQAYGLSMPRALGTAAPLIARAAPLVPRRRRKPDEGVRLAAALLRARI